MEIPHGGCKWYGCKICKNLRVGYHRISDDSVSSYAISDSDWPTTFESLNADIDIDKFWVRDYWTDEIIIAPIERRN